MSGNVKISIILPVYNVEEYLSKCLDSLVNQTFEDIEIICIDDGSADNSLAILNSYAQRDSRIKIIEQENSGCYVARNKGLEAAQGEYIMFVDSDDWLELDACESAYNQIKKQDSDLVIFNFYNINPRKEKNLSRFFNNLSTDETFYFDNCPEDFYYINTSIWAKLYKKSSICVKFDDILRKSADTVFFWRYCLHNPKISVLNIPLYNYLERESSLMFEQSNTVELKLFKAIQLLLNSSEYQNAPKIVQARIFDRFAKSLGWELRSFKNNMRKDYLNCAEKFMRIFEYLCGENINDYRYFYYLKDCLLENKIKLIPVLNKIVNYTVDDGYGKLTVLGITVKINLRKRRKNKICKCKTAPDNLFEVLP